MNGALKGFLAVLIIVVVLAAAGYIYYTTEVNGTFRKNTEVTVEIKQGSGAMTIATALRESGVIGNKYIFRMYVRGRDTNFQYGTFTLNPKSDYEEIIEQLEIMQTVRTTESIVIPEGYEAREIVNILADTGIGTAEEIKRVINDHNFDYPWIAQLPTDNEYRLEGFLFPDTYEIFSDATSENIVNVIGKMLSNFEAKTANLRAEVENEGGDFYDTIIMASIIEREGQKASELPIVASVFYNRLNANVKLQSCATVQYILEERKEVLSYADTEIDNPYNTYMNYGLTPGPIANPGLAAIRAAIYPDTTDYYFFVARYDGSHYFAKTYAQHEANVSKAAREKGD